MKNDTPEDPGAKFEIQVSENALGDLEWLKKPEQVRVFEEIEAQLRHESTTETRNRKRLRPNHVSEWELRTGSVRVFYNVDTELAVVTIVAVGLKQRSKLYFRGQEFKA